MKVRIVVTQAWLGEALQRLSVQTEPEPIGVARTGGAVEFLVPSAAVIGEPGTALLCIDFLPAYLRGSGPELFGRGRRAGITRRLGLDPASDLVDLALHPKGLCAAAWHSRSGRYKIDEVLVSGPRMERWRPGLGAAVARGGLKGANGEFSRTAGALGGRATHGRLRALSVAIVGCSRTGSLVAHHLVRSGVARVVLIDPDRVEAHLNDAVEIFADAPIGSFKVDATTNLLTRVREDVEVVAVPAPLEDPRAWDLARSCDVLVSAPDSARARLAAATLCVAHHRPHVDLGTGVFRDGGDLDAGFDVRLTLPGSCLLCVGGLELQRRQPALWSEQRAGSLRSLNMAAAGQAMLLLEALVEGRLEESVWVRGRVGNNGALEVTTPPVGRLRCPLCQRRAGLGDLATAGPGGA